MLLGFQGLCDVFNQGQMGIITASVPGQRVPYLRLKEGDQANRDRIKFARRRHLA